MHNLRKRGAQPVAEHMALSSWWRDAGCHSATRGPRHLQHMHHATTHKRHGSSDGMIDVYL